jgi:hypothetical protein
MSSERLDVVLAEFQSLRNEINIKLQAFYQIYTIYFAALGLFSGYIISKNKFDFLLAVPFVALALFYRIFYDQRMISLIDKYIKESLSEKQLPQILAAIEENCQPELPDVLKWLQFYESNKLPPYYKFSIFIIFIIVSVVMPMYYNIYALAAYYYWTYHGDLPILLLWLLLFVNILIGFWIAFRIIRDDY